MATKTAAPLPGDVEDEVAATTAPTTFAAPGAAATPGRSDHTRTGDRSGGARPEMLIPYVKPMDLEERVRKIVGEVKIADVIKESPYRKMRGEELTRVLVNEFNRGELGDKRVIVNAGARSGERVPPGHFMVAHKNKVCEIRAGTGDRFALHLTAGYTEIGYVGPKDGIVLQTEIVIGDYGTYIVNVPQSKIAKVWSGNQPYLLGEGPHVIHDPLFKPASGGFLVDTSDQHINHGNLQILRVPVGQYARVTINTNALLLPYRVDPYVFDTPLFSFGGFESAGSPYIEHGPLHLLRVPAGMIAKCWFGSKAVILEHREEAYFFDDPLFRVEKKRGAAAGGGRGRGGGGGDATDCAADFVDAQTKHVRHGTIDRLRPGVDGDLEKAVVQHDGDIIFVDRFTTLDNPNHAVLGFLKMGIQTVVFPSKETREERRRENPKATPEEIAYEPMTTKDSLKMGMKLLVAFQVIDEHLLLRKLRLVDIIPHVENLCVSDMVRAVQHTTSGNFLNARSSRDDDDGAAAAGKESAADHIVDHVKDELREHLKECGLGLVRFNIEEARVLDETIAREMAKQSLVAATANAEQAVLKQNTAIAKSRAELDAMSRRVQQEQENQIKIAAARADLEAARLRAEALVVEAEARQRASTMEAEVLTKYPALLQLRLAEHQAAALRGSNVSIIAPDFAHSPMWLPGMAPPPGAAAAAAPPRT